MHYFIIKMVNMALIISIHHDVIHLMFIKPNILNLLISISRQI